MIGIRLFRSLVSFGPTALLCAIQAGAFAQDEPPVSVFDTPVEFSGSRDQPGLSHLDEIRIGFFAPGDSESLIGRSMLSRFT